MSLLLPVLVIIFLILLNGLFVAAEFAIIGVRPSRLAQLSEEGNRVAKRLRGIVEDRTRTDHYIATAQLGITLASLGLGMYAEPVIASFVEGPLHELSGLSEATLHTISFVFSLTLITYLHVVIGEMVPKSLALQSAERSVLLLARPMELAGHLFSLPVRILNWIGLLLLRALGVPPAGATSRAYTSGELEMIVSESFDQGLLQAHERDLVANVFDFIERRVGQVMIPRTAVTAIAITTSEQVVAAMVADIPFSRLPVYSDSIDDILGVLHLKDFVRQQLSGENFDLRAMLRQVPFVPESLPVEDLLASFRRLHQHMAVVIDEHGGTLGLVTLEDLIEEVVGEVVDEFDAKEAPPLEIIAEGHIRARGTVLLETLAEEFELGEIEHQVQTIGGLALVKLGLPPREGASFELGPARVEIEQVAGMAVKQVLITFSSPSQPSDES